jgi:serine/threonine protein kinase
MKPECLSSPVALQDFEHERESLMRLNHPNIVKLYGYGTDPRPFLVLERLDGGSLGQMFGSASVRDRRRRFTRRKQLTYSQLLTCAFEMASALSYLHDDAIAGATCIHRDLKPDNIGFCTSGAVKIMDFGLCKLVKRRSVESERYQMTGHTGSLRYMAPEVVRAEAYNEKVDVYSFAIIMWQVAKLIVPFQGMSRCVYSCVPYNRGVT